MSGRGWCVAFVVTAWLGADGVASAGAVRVSSSTGAPGSFLTFMRLRMPLTRRGRRLLRDRARTRAVARFTAKGNPVVRKTLIVRRAR